MLKPTLQYCCPESVGGALPLLKQLTMMVMMVMVMIVVKLKLKPMIYPSSAGLILFFLLCYRVLLVVSMPPSSFFFTRVYIFFVVRIMTQTEDRRQTEDRD